MFETLARLYDGGAIQKCHLENAVDRGWITQSEKEEIVAAAEKNTPHQWGGELRKHFSKERCS